MTTSDALVDLNRRRASERKVPRRAVNSTRAVVTASAGFLLRPFADRIRRRDGLAAIVRSIVHAGNRADLAAALRHMIVEAFQRLLIPKRVSERGDRLRSFSQDLPFAYRQILIG